MVDCMGVARKPLLGNAIYPLVVPVHYRLLFLYENARFHPDFIAARPASGRTCGGFAGIF